MAPHGDPIAELVLTVLSQEQETTAIAMSRTCGCAALGDLGGRARTQSRRRSRRRSKAPGGISEGESVSYPAILQAISDGSSKACRFDWLADVPIEQARDYLHFPPWCRPQDRGVPAAVRLRSARCSVDTHVSRVGMRLRLLAAARRSEQMARSECFRAHPPGEELELHVNLHPPRPPQPATRANRLRRVRAGAVCPSRKKFLSSGKLKGG